MRIPFVRVLTLGLVLGAGVAGVALAGDLKNLQVLPKSTTKEQVKAIMKAQAKALDVECDYCHDVPDMASDGKPKKKIAREMMKMTAEINNKWLKGIKQPVTCGTCHRGKTEPTPFD